MKTSKQFLIILIFLAGTFTMSFGQKKCSPKSLISIEYNHLLAKLDNPIRIIAQQENPVSIEQLSASIQVYNSEKKQIEIIEENGCFIIHPDTFGIVEIKIDLGDTVETKTLRVKPIEAVGRLGIYGANTDKKIGAGEFKAQLGIIANIECCGFDARCKVLGFETIRISNRNQVEKILNQGGKFEEETRKIITKAESGDIFIFRQIEYKCPGSGKPQRLDDMIFEIE